MEVSQLPECRITVREKVLQQEMFYKSQVILSYTVRYPYFTSDRYQPVLDKLNSYYEATAFMYVKSDIMKLYQMAMAEYEYAVANDFPVRPFDAISEFYVTYNNDCLLSLYFDRYEYTGGAHGSTIRTSDTWDIKLSSLITLKDILPPVENVNEYVINCIIKQLNQMAKTEDFPYFEDYASLVKENFNPKNFYISDEGIIIYFQQYEIAPYSTGIPEFSISYCI